jgi:hypothetical protein
MQKILFTLLMFMAVKIMWVKFYAVTFIVHEFKKSHETCIYKIDLLSPPIEWIVNPANKGIEKI